MPTPPLTSPLPSAFAHSVVHSMVSIFGHMLSSLRWLTTKWPQTQTTHHIARSTRRFVPHAAHGSTPSAQSGAVSAMVSIAPHAESMRLRAQKSPASKPLRIIQVLEHNQPRGQAGRMVISGSMADVCAELDRLAACEIG